MMKWMFISLGLLALLCLSSGLVYNEGYVIDKGERYELGETIGYKEGVTVTRISDRSNGYAEVELGRFYTLRDPTYEEAIAFLRKDKTDENEYIFDTYECSHFSRDVCNNAEREGLRCAFVRIIFPYKAHAMVAFNTIDEGLVYFDPALDWRVKPVLGKHYYQCVEPEPGHRCKEPLLDDTIIDILVIW